MLDGGLVKRRALDHLLVSLAIMLNPARLMTFARVAVCPVNHAPFGVPFILAAEGDNIAYAKADDSWRQIDVVRDEQGLSRRQSHDEPLVSATIVVVREHPANDALPFHLHVARVLLEGVGEYLVAARLRSARRRQASR